MASGEAHRHRGFSIRPKEIFQPPLRLQDAATSRILKGTYRSAGCLVHIDSHLDATRAGPSKPRQVPVDESRISQSKHRNLQT